MKYISLLFIICLFSCGSKTDVADNSDLLRRHITMLENNIKENDSAKIVLIKATFMAGCRKGITIGINHSSASIPELEELALLDSLKFAKFVDISFPKK